MYYLTLQLIEGIPLPLSFQEFLRTAGAGVERDGSSVLITCADMRQASGILSALSRTEAPYSAARITAQRPAPSRSPAGAD